MGANEWIVSIFICLSFLLFLSKFIIITKKHTNLPQSPPSLPIIGHLHLIKEPLQRTLHDLSHKYGNIFFLRLGTRKVLVVSAPSAIEECFTRNDITFANRPLTLAGKHLHYNSKTMGFASYGDHWRNLRRLTTLELLSSKRLTEFSRIREEEVKLMVKQLFENCSVVSKVEMRHKLVDLSFNIMLRMITGKRYYGKHAVAREGKEFQLIMKEYLELHASGNLSDFFPILQWIDFQGVQKRMVKVMRKVDRFLQNLIDEHRKNTKSAVNEPKNLTLLDVMLDLQEEEPELCTNETVKGVILVMLIGGSETTATAIEWALSLLLNHPEAMNKTRIEIDTYVGHDKMLNELDTAKLKYLQNVITETFRLYPVAPLMIPHESSSDCKVGGFDIPQGTMLLVNLWTLHRDPELWVDPTRFVPERFEGMEGGDHEAVYDMIPFGVGRRVCPGKVLGKRVVGHVLGALIQCFDWARIGDEEIDMTEGLGITLPKAEPLVALCKSRQCMLNVLSNL